ncbi:MULTISPECIES: hypothetical protein [unclassified Streptomyces]|uniref:hypothetical protein n=1 Tax=unclassified Streptomyces TaxID=2593676 RepID=UPI002E1946D8|nr:MULTISPECIES: hypothetical protein [unclassified Streptomyces]
MLLALCLAALASGIATAWLLRGRGWIVAVLAGAGVTVSLPAGLAATMILLPPLGFAVALGSLCAALRAVDDGRVWVATAWATIACLALTCAGVAW